LALPVSRARLVSLPVSVALPALAEVPLSLHCVGPHRAPPKA